MEGHNPNTRRLTVHLTTDELEAILWAVNNFTLVDKNCGEALSKSLKDAKATLIAGMIAGMKPKDAARSKT